jgi:DNA-binding LacI/PurR family transcriptional regulator
MKIPKIQPIKARNKRPEIVESLTRLARRLGPKTRLPRTRELSKALGVTLATLDQGLRQLEERGLIERRPRSGIFVSPRILQRAVGMVLGCDIFSTKDGAFYSILLDRCAKRAASQRERFSFFLDLPNQNQSESGLLVHQDLVDALTAGKLDGLLVAAIFGKDQQEWLRSQNVPAVCFNFDGSPGSVEVDMNEMIHMAAKELTKSGCRNLGLMAPVPPHAELFRRAAQDFGFSFEESWIFCGGGAGEYDSYESMGKDYARQLLERGKGASKRNLPQGLIITDDIVARGACPCFAHRQIVIGRDLKIASHCNKGSLVLTEWEGALIRCQFDPEEIAEAMFSMLETLMDGGSLSPDTVSIRPHLLTA